MMAQGKPTEYGLHSDNISEFRRIPAQFHAFYSFSFLQGGLTSFPCQGIYLTTARSHVQPGYCDAGNMYTDSICKGTMISYKTDVGRVVPEAWMNMSSALQ